VPHVLPRKLSMRLHLVWMHLQPAQCLVVARSAAAPGFWLPWLWLLDWLCSDGAHAAGQHAMAKAAARVYVSILPWWTPEGTITWLSCACW
jgi:hypothetical protein